MKKAFLTISLCLLLTNFSNAQVTFKPGVRAGANISKFTNVDGSSSKTDFFVGGQLAIKFVEFYTLQPELTYSREGSKVSDVYYDSPFDPIVSPKDIKYTIDYLSLGIINKFTFGKGFQVMVGPTLDFKVGDNFGNGLSDELVGFDLALVGGLGYDFGNGIAIDARFKQGLVDIFGNNYNEYNDSNNNGNYDEVVLNQLFQLGVSYTFDLK